MKKIICQVLPNLVYGDAISDFVQLTDSALRSIGFESRIFSERAEARLAVKTENIDTLKKIDSSENIIIWHYSIGSPINEIAKTVKGRLLLFYYGITPSQYLLPYSDKYAVLSREGTAGFLEAAKNAHRIFITSEYLRQEIGALNAEARIFPLAIDFSKYDKALNRSIIEKYKDGKTNILTVGRVFPHKKIEDVIDAFYAYKKYNNPNSRLIIAGDNSLIPSYMDFLMMKISERKIEDVIFTGRVAFEDLISYYKTADVYLSMSEHEGFGVTLLEAMYLNVPTIAYNAAAVPETMGKAGIIINRKDFIFLGELMKEVVHKGSFRDGIIQKQKLRAAEFGSEKLIDRLKTTTEY